MKKSLVILLAATLGLTACHTEKKGPGGLLYTIYDSKGGEKIKEGDVIKLSFIQKNDKDSILGSTYENGYGQVFPVQKSQYKGDINDVLYLLGEGDSASFKINLDTMAFYSKQPKQDLFKNDKYMNFTVKVDKVFKKKSGEADSVFQKRVGEFFQADYKAAMEKIKGAEEGKIKKYEEDNDVKSTVTSSGLHYKIITPGDAQRATINDTVKVNYIGRLAAKGSDKKYKLFDTSDEKLAKAENNFKMGKPYGATKMALSGVVPGFTEGLQLIGKGGKILLIFPSKLGFGEQGAPQVGIGPFAPVTFEVELVEIIKGTAPAAAPAGAFPPPVVKP